MAINLAIEIESIDIRHTADVVDDEHNAIAAELLQMRDKCLEEFSAQPAVLIARL